MRCHCTALPQKGPFHPLVFTSMLPSRTSALLAHRLAELTCLRGHCLMFIVCSLLATIACKVLPKTGPRLLKFPPLFYCLNTAFAAAIASLSWPDLTALFEHHDVWYCPVNTPASALRFPQAQACQIFEEHDPTLELGAGVRVFSPILLSGFAAAHKLPAPPALGSRGS